jgi:UDP-N-acetylmuramyl pentapeptide phosphotransferase/UDP-N-acetylglucosamine-1-phosphate transferase
VIARLKGFAKFWYDFFVGDDWTVAVGVVLAIAATYGLSRAGVPAWWIMPVAVVILLSASVRRAARSRN